VRTYAVLYFNSSRPGARYFRGPRRSHYGREGRGPKADRNGIERHHPILLTALHLTTTMMVDAGPPAASMSGTVESERIAGRTLALCAGYIPG